MAKQRPFMAIGTHGFVRVGTAVPKIHLANPFANAKEHIRVLEKMHAKGVQYAVCPELGLTGYSCRDLFFKTNLLDAALDALKAVVRASRKWDGMMCSVGVPLPQDGKLFNCAVTILEGKVIAIAPKTHLPNYGEFEEHRWFAPAPLALRDTYRLWDGTEVPFGNDLLIRWHAIRNFVLHTEVCEDIWMPAPPSVFAALSGATVLANLSASNITIGKAVYRELLALASSGRNVAVQLYTAAGEGESTTDVSWDGDSYIAENGNLITRSERFARGSSFVFADVNLPVLDHDRRRQRTFADNAVYALAGRRPLRSIDVEASRATPTRDPALWHHFARTIDPHPFVPSNPALRDVRCRETFMIQSTALAQRLTKLPKRSRKTVIGISGGQDSTQAMLVAAHAMDRLKIPRANMIAVTMPGFGTSGRTYKNALALAKALGATVLEIGIKDLSLLTFEKIGHDPKVEDTTFDNVQAWCRKHVLFAVSAQHGGVVVGTGDLSELALGWCTYAGDHISHYGVNAGVPKTLISYLIKWTSDVIFKEQPAVQAVLDDVLATPISPELKSLGAAGEIVQKSEEENGPYELHDFFIYWYCRFGYGASGIARLALEAFGDKYTIGEIRKWLLKFLRCFYSNQFKRSVMPDGPKVGLVAFSPRGDLRMPSDADVTIWIEDVEKNVPLKLAA